VNGDFKPIWKQLPLPSEEERRLFEEWARRQEEKERAQENEDRKVIVIDI